MQATYEELRLAIGIYLGYPDPNLWGEMEEAQINAALRSGLRQFYFPPVDHVWSFLRPTLSLEAWADIPEGTYQVSAVEEYDEEEEETKLGLNVGVFDSGPLLEAMVGYRLVVPGEGEFRIKRLSTSGPDRNFYVHGDAGELSGAECSITADGVYALPAGFSGILGEVTHESLVGMPGIVQVGEAQIRAMRRSGVSSGPPRCFAVRPTADADGSAPQGFELLTFPVPDRNYTLEIPYAVVPPELSEGAPYPLGGAAHSETILESCLAAAENRTDDNLGIHKREFAEKLAASVVRDQQHHAPRFLGRNGNGETGDFARRTRARGSFIATYNGQLPY